MLDFRGNEAVMNFVNGAEVERYGHYSLAAESMVGVAILLAAAILVDSKPPG